MIDHNHYRGFEKEGRFLRILEEAVRDHPGLPYRVLDKALRHADDEYLNDLFSVRPCVRTLRYRRQDCDGSQLAGHRSYFIHGQLYESVDFNGGSYAIKGHENGRVGCTFFEVVEEKHPSELRGGGHARV
jgi:hypothetical protein